MQALSSGNGPAPEPVTDPIRPAYAPVARRGVRATAALLDVAAMASPALPLAAAAAALGAAEIVYLVVPVAFIAVWAWIQLWQGLTGSSFGKSMLGLRLVRVGGDLPGGPGRVMLRSLVFSATAGLAALPVLCSAAPAVGLHDRASGLRVVDPTQPACHPFV